MPRRLLPHFLVACLLLAAPPVRAWNAAGHRLVAAIAWQELGDVERARLEALLAAHPDVGRWDSRQKAGDERGFVRFTEASTWADEIRHDRRFFDEGQEAATPALAGFPDMARRRNWHYLNLPVDGSRPGDGELDRRIGELAGDIDGRRTDATQAYALVWLIHLVGDLHQPLHVATRRDSRGEHDAGGNRLAVFDPDAARDPDTSLHAWWDEVAGPPWLRGRRLAEVAESLRSDHPLPLATPAAAAIAHWRDESFRLARDFVYPRLGAAEPAVITAEYRSAARKIANERLVLAGRRLAALLHERLNQTAVRR